MNSSKRAVSELLEGAGDRDVEKDEQGWIGPPRRAEAQPIAILIADDDDDDRLLTSDAFRASRFANPLYFAHDGEELMDYLRHRGRFAPPVPSPRPGLLLLDLNMPRKDGREALREIKGDPELSSIVVVVLTTSETPQDVERIYSLGANSYISKPVTFDALIEAMKVTGNYWLHVVKLPECR